MSIRVSDYNYHLPQDRIALHPLSERDESKLLVFKMGKIFNRHFTDLATELPQGSFLFFNDTKVIPARLHFKKESGADIEVFLLRPHQPSTVLAEVMSSPESCTWFCTIGNLKRWTVGTVLKKQIQAKVMLTAELLNHETGLVKLSWTNRVSFAEIVTLAGATPLPPYLKREAEESDKERYQTIYSHYEGAVAAPTAGLHFTDRIFRDLEQKKIKHDFLTLHVSAGTFQPMKTEFAEDHTMHHEQVVVTRENIENLLQEDRFIIPVGTTAMRTLESLYWYGVKLMSDESAAFVITQEEPYQSERVHEARVVLQQVADIMDKKKLTQLVGETSIFIRPGYAFKVCKGLITNFHQPGSTLMLLVAAFIGENWKEVYKEALEREYRFLSYGDSSLLIPGAVV